MVERSVRMPTPRGHKESTIVDRGAVYCGREECQANQPFTVFVSPMKAWVTKLGFRVEDFDKENAPRLSVRVEKMTGQVLTVEDLPLDSEIVLKSINHALDPMDCVSLSVDRPCILWYSAVYRVSG